MNESHRAHMIVGLTAIIMVEYFRNINCLKRWLTKTAREIELHIEQYMHNTFLSFTTYLNWGTSIYTQKNQLFNCQYRWFFYENMVGTYLIRVYLIKYVQLFVPWLNTWNIIWLCNMKIIALSRFLNIFWIPLCTPISPNSSNSLSWEFMTMITP